MQDGNYEYQFEIAAREANRVISFSSASNTSGNAPGSPYVPSTSHSVGISMSNGADSWSKGSIPLSIVPNGGCLPSAAQARSSITPRANSSVEGADGEAKFLSSSTSCSGLKERDYIGLSDASSSSVQGSNYSSSALDEKHDAKSDLKDTELRLGLGPSMVSHEAVALELGNDIQGDASKTVSEARSDYNVVKIGTSHASGFDHPEQQVATAPSTPRKFSVDGTGISEKASRPAQHQSFHCWNGEQHLQPQRGHPPPTNAADKSFVACQDRHGNESRALTEVTHVPKEKPWSQPGIVNNQQQNDFSRQDAPHPHASVHSYAQKPPNGSLELRFASRDAPEKGSYDASAFQFWQTQITRPIEGFLAPSGQDANKSEIENGNAGFNVAPGGLVSGRYVVPVPKVSTVPAKRPYFEAMGDNRTGYPSEIRSDPRANVTPVGVSIQGGAPTIDGNSQAPKVHTAAGVLTWNNVILPAGWQMGVEQSKGIFGSMATSSSALPPRGQVASQFKPAAAASAPPAKESAKDGLTAPPTNPAKSINNDAQNEDGGSRAPVVGWPPIRSFRKNTLAAHPKPSSEDQDMAPSSDQPGQQASSTALYVKAKLDGVKICRKVDLKSYDSYDSLKLALQDMFHGFVTAHNGASEKNDNGRFDLFRGSDYVLTHEDKDGDWMLVGDVPWEMFVTTVKSLRIMKGSDALGLGQRASEKLKLAQATTT